MARMQDNQRGIEEDLKRVCDVCNVILTYIDRYLCCKTLLQTDSCEFMSGELDFASLMYPVVHHY